MCVKKSNINKEFIQSKNYKFNFNLDLDIYKFIKSKNISIASILREYICVRGIRDFNNSLNKKHSTSVWITKSEYEIIKNCKNFSKYLNHKLRERFNINKFKKELCRDKIVK